MKTKKLLVLPLVALMAGCSGKIVIYRDIFRDAKDIAEETRQEVELAMTGFTATSTVNVTVYIDDEEVSSKTTAYELVVTNDNVSNSFQAVLTNSTDHVTLGDVSWDGSQFVGSTPDTTVSPDRFFNSMKNLVFSWHGKMEVGYFTKTYYDSDETMLNYVSPKCSITPKDGLKGDMQATINEGSAASYRDGDFNYSVGTFKLTYNHYLLRSYQLAYTCTASGTDMVLSIKRSITTNVTNYVAEI